MPNPTTHVIEIESGIGEPAFVPLTLGQELQPLSIGRKAMWRIDGARLLDVHAFVYFDGTSLFMQSADESAAAVVDGYKIGKAWTELRAPCRIEVGTARLRFRSLLPSDDDRPTVAAARPPIAPPEPSLRPASIKPPPRASERPDAPRSFPKGERPFRPGELSHGGQDDESTRFAPLPPAASSMRSGMTGAEDALSHGPETRPDVVPARRPPSASDGYATAPPAMPTGMQPMQPHGAPPPHALAQPSYPQYPPYAPPQAPPSSPYAAPPHASFRPGPYPSIPAAKPQPLERLVLTYKQLSAPLRIVVLAAPLGLGLMVFSLRDGEPTTPARRSVAVDAGAPTATVPATPIVAATAPWPAGVPCPPPGWPADRPPPCVPNYVPPPATAPPVPTPVTPPKDAGAIAPVSAKTLERQAVDAVAAGDYPTAAAIYEELSRKDPNNRVYAEAARILRRRLDPRVP